MKLEEQVCSLDLAKRLKELGVKQESYFYWIPGKWLMLNPDQEEWVLWDKIGLNDVKSGAMSAFTVAELGEMLPDKGCFSWKWHEEGGGYSCIWHSSGHDEQITRATTEADARATMLIYLLENNPITI